MEWIVDVVSKGQASLTPTLLPLECWSAPQLWATARTGAIRVRWVPRRRLDVVGHGHPLAIPVTGAGHFSMSLETRAGEAEREQAGRDLLDDRHHVDVVGVEALRERRPLSTPLDREAEHLSLRRVKETP